MPFVSLVSVFLLHGKTIVDMKCPNEIYRAVINDLDVKKLLYFQNGYRYKNETILRQQGTSLIFSWPH
jgi:hypothetical protein